MSYPRPLTRDLLAFLGCCALALLLGVWPGQDGSWDLRNYHFYNPYAWLNGRLDVDVAPAQLQTWISPLWDLGYYALVRAGAPSPITTGLLAMPAAAALFFLVLVARRLSPSFANGWALAATVAIGSTAAASTTVIGTTNSEWHVTALVMVAIWLVLVARDGPRRGLTLIGLAGACAGAAAGLKLTAAPFALGLATMVVLLPIPRRRGACLAALAAGGLVGFLVVFGPWGWELYQRYRNPFFPFFNNLFQSTWVHDVSYRDPRFGGRGLWHVLTLPLALARTSVGLVSEGPLREPRLALALPALVFLSTWSRHAEPDARARWRAILGMFVVSYVAWATVFGYMRYAGTLELLSAAAAVAALAALLPRRARWQLAGATALAAIVIAATIRPGTHRVPHGPSPVVARAPRIPENAMVVIATSEPIAYVVPSLPPAAPVISLANNFLGPEARPTKLWTYARRRVHEHVGPLLLLTSARDESARPSSGTPLAALGLRSTMERCAPIETGLDGDGSRSSDLALCDLEKLEQRAVAR